MHTSKRPAHLVPLAEIVNEEGEENKRYEGSMYGSGEGKKGRQEEVRVEENN